MRWLALLLLLTLMLAALEKGGLQFTAVTSQDAFKQALAEGPVLIYFHQPDCAGCKYLEANVYTDPEVVQALSNFSLLSIDVKEWPLVGLEVYTDGLVYVYAGGRFWSEKISGRQMLPILGTPTVVMGYVKNGDVYVKLVVVGPLEAVHFMRLLETAFEKKVVETTPAPIMPQLLISFAAGALSVFSPCVLPVLTIAATTYLARRNLSIVLAGMLASFSVLASAAALAAGFAGVLTRTALYTIGGVVLILVGSTLVVEKLNKSFATWASRIQTSAFKSSRGARGAVGDVLLGMSLGAVWMPCVAPIFGAVVISNIMISALSGDLLAVFAATFSYAAGLAVVVYLVIAAVRRGARRASQFAKWAQWGRRMEYAVGFLAIALGLALLGEAAGLQTFSKIFTP